jgi:hypothetical protein
VLAAAALLGLSGCAGDDSATSDTDTDTAGTAGTTGTTAGTTGTTASTSSATATTTAGTTAETTTTGTTTSGGAVDYQSDIQPIFDDRCVANCHAPGGSNKTLLLGPDDSYASIVGVQSVQSALNIVEPGDPDKSYLWHKLNGSQSDVGGSGLSMPFGVMLDGASLQLFETWITDGAKP